MNPFRKIALAILRPRPGRVPFMPPGPPCEPRTNRNARLILTALRKLALGAVLVWGAIAGTAQSATIPTAADRPAHEALGAQQEETVWFEGNFNGATYYASGILIRGLTSDWVLTAGHAVKGTNGTVDVANIAIGNGTSYLNDRGQSSGITEMIISTSFVPSNPGAGADFAFLRLSTPISSPNLYFRIGSKGRTF